MYNITLFVKLLGYHIHVQIFLLHYLPFFSLIEPSECTNGDYRLVNGYIPQQGRVEVCVNGVWGSVCGSGWNKNSAFVVCKNLGFLNSGL